VGEHCVIITRYEEILSSLEAMYSVKPDKFKDQLKDMNENFGLINTRRCAIRKKCLEATRAIDQDRNQKESR
jgi:hypothetical protein